MTVCFVNVKDLTADYGAPLVFGEEGVCAISNQQMSDNTVS